MEFLKAASKKRDYQKYSPQLRRRRNNWEEGLINRLAQRGCFKLKVKLKADGNSMKSFYFMYVLIESFEIVEMPLSTCKIFFASLTECR